MNLIEYLLGLLAWGCLRSGQAWAFRLEAEQSRTAGPWLYLLAYPTALQQVGGVGALPGIPIRRPQDETPLSSSTRAPLLSEEEPSSQNILIREQFLQGILQGLQQSAGGASGNSISPALLADFLSQASITSTSTTRSPSVEKYANEADSDENYDYIDFKNGSRIKFDLEVEQKPANKIIQQTTTRPVAVDRAQPQQYLYYRPYTSYYHRVG
ncbi:uncharacterized protein LOC6593191 [Drosophila persimilis]|uniref:uncharacterized protein LOC6593191 n=1 Tax=Drosophila persimilis TaxID=7234 RepID=UPI000F07AF13|nr:uncharacterized protein LOC6593191 [Drosophila persimilis]